MKAFLKSVDIDKLLIAGNIFMFILLLFTAFLIVRAAVENNVLNRLKQWMKDSENNRITEEEMLRLQEGKQEKANKFYRLDLMLNQSGIKRKLEFMSSEYLILLSVLSAVAGYIVTGMIKSWNVAAIVGMTVLFIPFLTVKLLAGINHGRVEKQIIHFLNMIENYSRTQDNIVSIFGKVYPFLEEPLSTAVRECYTEAYNTGDVSVAFRKLESKIVHEKLSDILQNLELCGMHEANYQVIISESRAVMTRYIASKTAAKGIADKAKYEFITLIVSLFMIVKIMSAIMEINVLSLLMGSAGGMVILTYLAVILVYGAISIFTAVKM